MHIQPDFLVIGSGIAGLSFALKTAMAFPDKRVVILTKSQKDETNTKYAQGGIASVWDGIKDSFEKHIEDTLIAGDGLCNPAIVQMIVEEGPNSIQAMIALGANFDKNEGGQYALGKEGGHSEYRILHHKDATGKELENTLLKAVETMPNIQIIDHCFVIDLITQHHLGYLVTKASTDITCYGVYVLNLKTHQIEKILASITLLATGGCGQVYRSTTNPTIATGDGVAMFYRAKGRVENMEFIQFHPTALYEPNVSPSFLITEAMRGEGAILRNHKKEAFMEKYDIRKDLAPRDIVARAIDKEMKQAGKDHIFLDCTQMDKQKFQQHFPTILEKCISIGINPFEQYIPVSPAAHYSCGGIKTDDKGASSIKNLYACGECASTGLHGANRLASNSLLEAMVMGNRAATAAAKAFLASRTLPLIPDWDAEGTTDPAEMILITQSLKELQQIMSDYVGIVRTNTRLERAMKRLDLLFEETETLYRNTTLSPQLAELRNLITVAYLIVKGAQLRQESRGLHYNTDYPEKADLLQNIVL